MVSSNLPFFPRSSVPCPFMVNIHKHFPLRWYSDSGPPSGCCDWLAISIWIGFKGSNKLWWFFFVSLIYSLNGSPCFGWKTNSTVSCWSHNHWPFYVVWYRNVNTRMRLGEIQYVSRRLYAFIQFWFIEDSAWLEPSELISIVRHS